LNRKKIYDIEGLDGKHTKLIGGKPSGIINMNNIKYEWAYKLWNVMLANTWTANEVTLNDDIKEYKTLSLNERYAYDKALSQLIFMDSVQTNQIMDNLNPYITAPEVNILLARQAFEEALHSQSYSVLVDGIADNSEDIYDLWKTDAKLKEKNIEIGNIYIELANNPTDENILLSMFANVILEGIYFYSGFTYFYALSRAGKMRGTTQMIKFIQRDENTHLSLFQSMIKTMRIERPDLFTKKLDEKVYSMFKKGCELEVSWGQYITNGQILGLTNDIIKQYIQFLCDKRLRTSGLEPIYNSSNPITWIDTYNDFNAQKVNFFEGNVTNYKKGGLDMSEEF
jgi:ribonucleoside-diphosphate reductase beta chain